LHQAPLACCQGPGPTQQALDQRQQGLPFAGGLALLPAARPAEQPPLELFQLRLLPCRPEHADAHVTRSAGLVWHALLWHDLGPQGCHRLLLWAAQLNQERRRQGCPIRGCQLKIGTAFADRLNGGAEA